MVQLPYWKKNVLPGTSHMCKLKCIGEKMFLNKNIFKDYLAFEQQVCVHLENMSVCHTDLPKSVLAGVGE